MIADGATAVVVGAVALAAMLATVRPLGGANLARHLLLTVASAPVFFAAAVSSSMYRARANESRASEFRNIVRTVVIGTLFMVALAFAVGMENLSRLWVGVLATSLVVGLTVERAIARRIFARLRTEGRMRRRIVIVGTDEHAVRLSQLFGQDPSLGYEVVGFAGPAERDFLFRDSVLGPIDDVEELLVAHHASGVVMSPAAVSEAELNVLTRELTDHGYHVAISATLRDIDIARLRPQSIDGRSVLYVEPVARSGAPLIAKRVFDIVMASALLVLTLPLLAISAIAVKLTSRGPVLFRQTRVGLNGATFTMTKLRTMVVDAEDQLESLADLNEADGPLFKMQDDPRVTRVGRFLRRSSIDELPQLVSVIKGDMSMVGPRPALPCEVAQWDEVTRQRLRVLPGLTGLWQVSGRSDASFAVYRRLDLFYVDNWSLRHDLSICLRTIRAVIRSDGAQ